MGRLYRCLRVFFRAFTPRMTTTWEEPFSGNPSVFVCNHVGAFGPIDMVVKFPLRDEVRVWCNEGIMNRETCPAYVRQDYWWEPGCFFEPLLNMTIPYLMALLLPPILGSVPGVAGERKRVLVYTNGSRAELFLNGVSLGVRANVRGDPKRENVLEWDVPYAPGVLEAVADVGGGRLVRHAVRTAGEAVRIDVDVEAPLGVCANGRDLVFVTCRAVDAHGTLVRSSSNRVAFVATGCLDLLAVDDGDHATDELFVPEVSAKSLHDGFALAIFRTRRTAGEATVSVRPEGLPERTVTVEVKRKGCQRTWK